MAQEHRQLEDKRGLRFPFSADAEVVLPSASEKIAARVTELSFRGCFLEISAALQEKQRVRVKIFHSDEFFEAPAEVIYVQAYRRRSSVRQHGAAFSKSLASLDSCRTGYSGKIKALVAGHVDPCALCCA